MITCPTCKGEFLSYLEFTAHIGSPTCANEINEIIEQHSLTQECIDAGTDWYHTPELGTPTLAELERAMEETEHLDPPTPAVVYLNPTSREMYNWQRAGLCMWCGGNCFGDKCRLRKCTSCSELWVADSLAEVSDGYQVTEEYCPPCKTYMNHVHAADLGRSDHIICGSVICGDIKVGPNVTCPECLLAWHNLHLISPAPIFCEGDPL